MTSLYGSDRYGNYDFVGYGEFAEKPSDAKRTIMSELESRPEFSKFVKTIKQSGYAKLLNDPSQNLTLFAPSDVSFLGVSASTKDALYSMYVDDFVGYHIARGKIMLKDMVGRTYRIPTYSKEAVLVRGEGIAMPKIGRVIKRTNTLPCPGTEPDITDADNMVSNGVIHVVSRPLIPESFTRYQ